MQGAGMSQQTERGDKSGQTETVIAMEMADEDMNETSEMELFVSELSLDTFSAIDHVEFVAQVDYLRRGMVVCGWQGRSAAQYMYTECCHIAQRYIMCCSATAVRQRNYASDSPIRPPIYRLLRGIWNGVHSLDRKSVV